MDACFVLPTAEDEMEKLFRKLYESSDIDLYIFCLDEDAHIPWVEKYGHVVRCSGFGMGKALEAGFRYARQLGVEWIIKSDPHVEFLDPPSRLLTYPEYVKYPRHCARHEPPRRGIFCWDGLYITYSRWEYRWSYDRDFLPLIMDPVYAIHMDLCRLLWEIQGKCYVIPYWGKEVFDITLTLSRLGHPVMVDRSVRVIHYYKKDWPRIRVVRRCIEPWCGEEIGEQPYFFSMKLGDVIYAYRHYPNPEEMPFWRGWALDRYYPYVLKYYPDLLQPAPGMDTYTIYRMYGLLEEDEII